MIKFMYNGIKINGKLIKGSWNKAGYTNGAKYAFYADSYFCKELRECFQVINKTEIMEDYFETETIYFFENDKNIKEIEKAYNSQEFKRNTKRFKKLEKMRIEQPFRFEMYYKTDYEELQKKLA